MTHVEIIEISLLMLLLFPMAIAFVVILLLSFEAYVEIKHWYKNNERRK